MHPVKGSHWVTYKNENYVDSYGCPSPKLLSNHKIISWKMFFFFIVQNSRKR